MLKQILYLNKIWKCDTISMGRLTVKEIIYNYDYLKEEDITEIVIRTKALIINNKNIILGNENNIYQFPGGHLEDNETFEECLIREILEETGIEIDSNEIKRPFIKVTYLNKDWPEIGKNRKSEIYYYLIETSKNPDLSKVKYTEHEKLGNFKIESIPLDESISVIENNISKNEKNKVIAPDMIMAITEYLHQCEE
jgi:8-oxo-dGTP diphosphatase